MDIMDHAQEVKAQLTAVGAPFELVQLDQGEISVPVYLNAPKDLSEVIEASRRDDESTFLVYQDDVYSYRRFYSEVDALAIWFHEQGVVQGTRVAIALRNRPEWAVSFAAIAKLGAVPVPLNSLGQPKELWSAIDEVMPKILVCDKARWNKLDTQVSNNIFKVLVVDDNDKITAEVSHYEDAIVEANTKTSLPRLNILPEDTALILFTSGASSNAKAVISTQRAVCQALYNIDYISAISAMTSPKIVARIMANAKPPMLLTAVPLFHVSGLHAQLLTALRSGRGMVMMHRWDPTEAVKMIKQHNITQFNGAPSMVMQLLREPGFLSTSILDNMAGLGFGGSGLPEVLVELVLKEMPNHMVGSGFGMTESNGVGSSSSGELFRVSPKSSGMLSPLVKIKVCDPIGDELSEGEIGEICIQSVTVMREYLNNHAGTQEAIRNGWLHTGDIGYLDHNGFLFIVDRLKNVIIRNGENIASVEVESSLMLHNAVKEAAVFGVADEMVGESVVAVISLKNGHSTDEEALKLHVAGQLASYKVPSTIHIIDDDLPRNPAGKLQHNQLKAAYSANQ
ncbi:AMP-dependent synthetase and ligase [Shewanella halifaxensis HAW-EB4]|uniref:AMP-dependent synthetase and ligase n=1 Tax=Shewanella halifaxensis (strain HAW-EB4) TaxID=458817 RepID=B0TTT7_SHEHH|nr:class I adenylate-forming enzyme family protein [Shewanella halifaxensis]ABZ76655.1 AMP-dependent synthetase and ligase [Shewanella halifaxensis HAW-EB4]